MQAPSARNRKTALALAVFLLAASVAGCIGASDTDHDGVLDSDDADDDNDGMPDAFEQAWALNPLDAKDGSADPDGDSLSNADEFRNGTVPRLADSDADGMDDGFEVAMHLNPLDATDAGADADSDGASNRQEFVIGTSARNADTDGDNMTDGWEIAHGLDPLNRGDGPQDPDDDRLANDQEFVLGTDPHDADTDGDTMEDRWEHDNGFNPVDASDGAADGDHDSFDANFDGAIDASEVFSNAREFAHTTDPADADTDGDGATDGYEWVFGLDPLNPADAALDQDGDGLSTLSESEHGTSPTRKDTDSDTMNDSFEITYNLQATNASDAADDPDADGLPNAGEAAAGSNPHNNDTDADGILDGADADPAHNLRLRLRISLVNVTFKSQPSELGFDPPWEIQIAIRFGGVLLAPANFTMNGAAGTAEWANLMLFFEADVDDGVRLTSVDFEISELDFNETVGVNADDILDTDPTGNNYTLTITFDLVNGTIGGEVLEGRADGAADGRNGDHDARIEFILSTFFV